jgi:hypothetical protein
MPDEDAWADARARYEQTAETLSSIAARLGLHHNALRRQVELRGWTVRLPPQKKPSTRATLMKLRETLQARITQFEQQIAELGKEVDALGNEKEARAMNLLVRTLEKVLDLERKHKSLGKKQREHAKRLDDAARAELVRRIEALAPMEEGEAIRQ